MISLIHDLRHAARVLTKARGFTAVAVLALALGIGANTAIFSMVNGILLRALPYRQPQRLYTINEMVPQWSQYRADLPVRSGNFLVWRQRCPAFASMAELLPTTFNLTGAGQPEQLHGAVVSSGLFSMLGIHPQLGRTFAPEEDQAGHDHEVVLTHQLWEQTFHSDSSIVGKALDLNGGSFTVVGVLPATFRFPRLFIHVPQIFKPLGLSSEVDLKAGIGTFNWTVISRLKPGVSPKQALAQLDAVESQIAQQANAAGGFPQKLNLYALLRPLKTVIVGPAQEALWMLFGAAGFVLLIVCVNLANLVLVRNNRRLHELALRSALGATPGRLMRQLLAEGAVLAAAGGSLGLLLAKWGLWLLVINAPLGIPRAHESAIDLRVLAFTLIVSAFAALLFALLPALRAAGAQPADALKSAGPTASTSRASARLRGALVIVEVALSAVVLAGALLFTKSLIYVLRSSEWMSERHVLAVDLALPPTERFETTAARYQFYSGVLERVKRLPGVKAAGFVNQLPLLGMMWGDDIAFQEAPQTQKEDIDGNFRFVSPDYFRAIGLPLIQGRLISRNDRGKEVALISESVARRVLPGRNPLGMHLLWRGKRLEVIGVAGNVRTEADKAPVLAVYVPLWSFNWYAEMLVVRTAMNPEGAARAIRNAVWSVDDEVASPREETLENIVQTTTAPRLYETVLGVVFAACAVFLAALGLYGVISYSVSERTQEIGIRMALGAQKSDVLKMVVSEGLKLSFAGLAAGIVGGLALARVLSSLLYGVRPDDPGTFLLVFLVLIVVALLACYLPARRATRVQPTEALRYE
jgi:predicted permease